MASYNRVIMVGNLTRDPELKQLSSSQSVCRLGLASNRQFKNKISGQTIQEVCFIDVDVWGPQAASCSQYLKKGRSVLIEGRLKLDSWQDNDGKNRSKHSIVADRVTFLNAPNEGQDFEASSFDDQSESSKFSEFQPAQSTPIKKATAKKSTKKSVEDLQVQLDSDSEESFGEVRLDSSKPFEDDLPF